MTPSEDPRRLELIPEPAADDRLIDRAAAEQAAAELLVALGADLLDEQLRDTPRRMVGAYAALLTPEPFRATTFPNEQAMTSSSARPRSTLCACITCCPFTASHMSDTCPGDGSSGSRNRREWLSCPHATFSSRNG